MLIDLLPPNASGRIYDGEQSISWQRLLSDVASVSAPAVFWPADNSLDSIKTLVSALQSGALAVPYNPKFSSQQLAEIHQVNNFSDAFPSHLCTAIFTSGSTGVPKLVAHSLANHLANANKAHNINPTLASSRWHMSLPLYHIGGLAVFFRCLIAGCDLVLNGRVDDADFLRSHKITHASCVATQLQRLGTQNLNNLSLSSLLVGGGPVPSQLLTLPLPIRYTYGMSELSSQACTQGESNVMHWLCNHRFTNNGELLVSGNTLFQGYLCANKLVDHVEEFATSDMGEYRDHWLYINGRTDNQFISGGENIQPEAVEACLLKHPDIIEAIIVAIDDAIYGKRPFAFIRLQNTRAISPIEADIRHYCQVNLPGYMRPIGYAQLDYEQLKPSRALLATRAEQLRN